MLETQLVMKIQGEQQEKFKRKNTQVEIKDQKFSDYIQQLLSMIGADFAKEQDRIKATLKEMADKAKTTGEEAELIKKSLMYPASGTSNYVPLKE